MRTLLALAITCSALAAQAATPSTPQLPVETVVLPNGLTVLYAEDHHASRVAVDLAFHVGSAEQRAGRSGFAHLFEHILFAGTGHFTREAVELLREDGVIQDGWTAFDETHYWLNGPANTLERLLWVESDRLGYLLPAVNAQSLEHSKGEVQNERLLRQENAPYGMGALRLIGLLFAAPHAYHDSVIGSARDLDHATLEDVRAFFSEFYTPERASIAIVGDFDRKQAEQWVQRYLATLPKRPTSVSPGKPLAAPLDHEVREVLHDRVPLPRVSVAWSAGLAPSEDEPALDILDSLLRGEGGLLSERLVRKGLAESANCSYTEMRLGSMFNCAVTAAGGKKPADVERSFDAIFEELRTVGPTPQAVQRAVAAYEGVTVRDQASLESRAGNLNHYRFFQGDAGFFARDLERHAHVTPEMVRAAAVRWLDPKRRAVVTILPIEGAADSPKRAAAPMVRAAKSDTAPWSDPEPWRKTRPPLAASRPAAPPTIQRLTLDNGVPVYLIENHALPLVTVDLMSVGGISANPPGLASAELTSRILTAGAGSRDADALAAATMGLGATLKATAEADTFFVELDGLRAHLEPALDLFADVVQRPRLEPSELERVRAQAIDETRRILSGRSAARVALTELIYGSAHPYARTSAAGEAALKRVHANEIGEYLRRYVQPRNCAFLVAGDVTPEWIRRALGTRFAKWKATAEARTAPLPPAAPAPTPHLVLLERPGAAQANIVVGRVVPARSAADWEAADLATRILAGTYTARLNANLRIRRAITYFARGYLRPRRGPSYVELLTDTPIASTPLAVGELVREAAGLFTHPPDADEIRLSRNQMTLTIADSFATNSDALSELRDLVLHALPLDHYSTWPTRLNALEGPAILTAARRYLDGGLSIVVIGPPSLGAELEKLGLGSVERRAVETVAE